MTLPPPEVIAEIWDLNSTARFWGLTTPNKRGARYLKPHRAPRPEGTIPPATLERVAAAAAVGLSYWSDHPLAGHIWVVDDQRKAHVVRIYQNRKTVEMPDGRIETYRVDTALKELRTDMTIAQQFPARRQPDGTTWYRAAGHDDRLDMGWTSDLAHAHADYRADDAPEPLPYPADPWVTDDDLSDAPVPPLTADPAPSGVVAPDDRSLVGHPDLAIAGPAVARVIGEAFDATELYSTTTTKETPAVTALTADFEDYSPPRTTQWMGYPLPPAPPRASVKFGAWGWYQLPSPSTGRPTGYPRATTIADTLDDQYGLNRWKRRETAMRIHALATMNPDTKLHSAWDTTAADALGALLDAMNGTKVTAIDDVLDTIDNLLGGAEARELGECVHAWLEALWLGVALYRDVPDLVRPHIDAAFRVMAHRGIVARPEYVERVVLNDQGDETVAGRIDCIWEMVTTGELVLGDTKTSKDLHYCWLPYGVQIGGCYGWATKILTADGRGWEPMPEIRQDFAILLHVPSNEPDKAAAITIDMWWGGEVMAESLATRRRRKEAKNTVPRHALPAPSDRALRIVQARHALSKITSPADGQGVYETFQDVWNDDLQEFAEIIAELF